MISQNVHVSQEKIASSPNIQPPEHVFDGLVEKVIAASLGELTVGHQGFLIVTCKGCRMIIMSHKINWIFILADLKAR